MSDLIDRQAVIDLLKQMRKDADMVPWEGKDVFARIRKLPTIQPEKTQLSQEGTTKDTTSDTISKTETVEHLRRMLEATVPNTDYDEGFIDGVEFGISTVSTMPTIQSQSTAGQLNDSAQSTAQSTDLIDRGQAIEKFTMTAPQMSVIRIYEAVEILESMPTIQPEPHWIPVSERLPRDGSWNIFTDGKNISVERYKEDAIDHFFPNGRWFQLEDAIAWMPLPEPYNPNK